MVLGLPNTGKSSLINALKLAAKQAGQLGGAEAYHKRAKAGPLPGVTRHLSGFKVASSPLAYLLDTPGILAPNLGDDVTALKLALTGRLDPDPGSGTGTGPGPGPGHGRQTETVI